LLFYYCVILAAADDILRAQGVTLDSSGKVKSEPGASFDEQQRRASAISDIENAGFVQASFKSTRTEVFCGIDLIWMSLSLEVRMGKK